MLSGGIDFLLPAGASLPPCRAAVVTGLDPAAFRARHTVPEATLAVELSKPMAPISTGADAGWVPYILVEKRPALAERDTFGNALSY